jgi:hypothetical protein
MRDTILSLAVAVAMLAGCAEDQTKKAEPEPTGPAPIIVRTSNGYDRGTLQRVDVGGVRCVVFVSSDGRGGGAVSCDWVRPPAYGDVGPELPSNAACTTDTDCMQKFGGDGSPRPLWRM